MRRCRVAAAVVIVFGCAHGTTAKEPDRSPAESTRLTSEPQASVAAGQPPVDSARSAEPPTDERAQPAATGEEPQEKPPKAPVRGDIKERAMAQMIEFKNQMCACNEMTCAQRVSDDMMKWAQEMNRSGEKPPQMTDEDSRQAKAIGQELAQCMQRASKK